MKLETALYALVTFLSAFLLFLLEPIAGRQLLPLFGGSAAVWTICLVFFQCALLAGYGYAHLLVSRLAPRSQTLAQIVLLTAALASLELRVHPTASALTFHPLLTLWGMLTAAIGLPFLALAATSPLLQAWHARSSVGNPSPWWLFALSNAGSLLALFLYPVVIETNLALHAQTYLWAVGFCLFAALNGALALRNRRAPAIPRPEAATATPTAPASSRLLWMLLPACGSMLLCAVTSHLGENIASIPLLWILPLAAYLLSFIVAFSSPRAWPRFISVRMLAVTLATFAYLLFNSRYSFPLFVSIPVYTGALLFSCLFCHAELYRLRPAPGSATNYYLLIAFGSAIGAIFVGIAAPNLFHANHDLAISVIALAATALLATWRSGFSARVAWTAAALGLVYVATVQSANLRENAIAQLRSFYGSLRVTETHLPPEAETARTLYHGRIQHGTQLFGNGLRTQPSSYYSRDSGVGLALDLCCEGHPKRVGVVGLGTGTVAAYGEPGDQIVFYEIDPLVERLARALFTYLRDSPAETRVVLGDARLSIAREAPSPANQCDVIVLDAFSGDAIPVHLLTAEAIALYRRHLRPGGLLVFNISSQYLDLAPQLALQARHAGMKALLVHSHDDEARGLFAADWVILTANDSLATLPALVNAAQPIETISGEIPGLRLWTDDYSSLLPLLRWQSGFAGTGKQ
jgi:SAM-dependent methyltransferase